MTNYPTNDESLAQTNDDVFDIAQVAVNLAMAVLIGDATAREQAIEVLGIYADWRNMPLPYDLWRVLMVRNYGEEETQALIEEGWKPA